LIFPEKNNITLKKLTRGHPELKKKHSELPLVPINKLKLKKTVSCENAKTASRQKQIAVCWFLFFNSLFGALISSQLINLAWPLSIYSALNQIETRVQGHFASIEEVTDLLEIASLSSHRSDERTQLPGEAER